ncbi:MAG TPA: nucleoside hydrolase [Acidimicrobiales bacterium]|nr:nucleoside hydrolase [Acidimicrobiales bacterium]
MTADRVPLVIDTDGGVDDAAALWYLLGCPQVDVLGITAVWGNVGVEQAAANVCRVLAAAGRREIPVALGAAGPTGPAPPIRRATGIHGSDGLGDCGMPAAPFGPTGEPAAEMLARLCASRSGEVVVVSLGPLSNLAHVVEGDPGWAAGVRDLVVMGGSARRGGNALPAAEANIGHDPLAAALVVGATWATPPTLVTLDATLQATLRSAELDLARERRTPAAAFMACPLAFYSKGGSTFSAAGTFPCHDLCAAVAVTDPEVLDARVVPLAVDTGGSAAWGMTVVDARPWQLDPSVVPAAGNDTSTAGMARWRVAFGADAARLRAKTRQLFGDDPGAGALAR